MRNCLAYFDKRKNIKDLDRKIKFSFEKILEYNLKNIYSTFNPMEVAVKDEVKVIYYMENILFITSILWDLLAQICNIYWEEYIAYDKIYYKSFFNNRVQGKSARPFAKKVFDYLTEDNDVSNINGKWNGNHSYLKDMRDSMTHRSSQNITSLTNFELNMKVPFIYILKRLIEDYNQVFLFLNEILNDIEKNFDS